MSHIVTVITLNTKITTAYNFEKSTFPTNDVPNNTCSRPDANSADPDQTAPLAAKSLQKKQVLKCQNNLSSFSGTVFQY